MKWMLVCLCSLIIMPYSQAQKDSSQVNSRKLTKEISYAYGYSFASDLSNNENFEKEEVESKYVVKGLKDGMKPDSAKLAAIIEGLVKRIEDPTNVTTGEAAQETAYNLGYNALGNLISVLELEKKDLHYPCIKDGYLDFVKGKTPEVELERQRQLLTQFLKEKQQLAEERARARRQQQSVDNLAKAQTFLQENSQKKGIQTTNSGLQYQVIKEGTGARPSINSRVLVHYTGTFIDGKVFDSSIERGEPTEFPLSAVIKGWQEGLSLMRAGGRYRLFIPPALAYGTDGPASIPPNALLIFEVELLQVMEEEEPGSPKHQLSYAYGYTVGEALISLDFTEQETNVQEFVKGFEKGFENKAAQAAAYENQIKARIASGKPFTSAAEAAQIAQGIGYASSYGLVQAVEARAADFSSKALAAGYKEGLYQQKPFYTREEMDSYIKKYAATKDKQAPNNSNPSPNTNADDLEENLKRGQEFLTNNVTKEGVIALPSGLQYQVLKEGTGTQPTINSTVTTHYKGTLIDGTVFDSSYERAQPATFPLNRVIKGWQEGIPLMKEGAKYRLFIPAQLGYGNRAQGAKIPAGSVLIFEVELLEVK